MYYAMTVSLLSHHDLRRIKEVPLRFDTNILF